MAKRTNPLLVLRKAIYKGGMTVNPQFNHKKREEMVPLHSYLCMCVHERERERETRGVGVSMIKVQCNKT